MDVGLVCDGCSAFNAMGTSTCARCHSSLSLSDDQDAETSSDAIATLVLDSQEDDANSCSMCGANVTGANRFCGACGNPLHRDAPIPRTPTPMLATGKSGSSKKTLFFSSIQAAKAKLVLIKGEGNDGESYALAGNDHRIGREDADIVFDEDPFLSPTHANFFYVAGRLVVKDEDSVNGVYLRIRGAHPIQFDDFFLIGEQVMQVRPVRVDGALTPTDDGTYLYSSPRRPARFELIQILQGGAIGLAHRASSDVVAMGRESNEINFPDDPFISGRHAQVAMQGDALTLSDLGSKNGTFVRITKETPLEHGDYVFMGQQLLRVEIV